MARAKRTARADARRRHRAQFGDAGEPAEAEDQLVEDTPSRSAERGAPVSTARSRPRDRGDQLAPPRPAAAGGIRNAFKAAFRPLDLRTDVRMLPRLLAHRAFWLPALLSAATAVAVVAFRGQELISQFALTYFVFPPPVGALFLAGFLAPRASYLIGFLVGVLSSVLFAIVVASVPDLFPGGSFNDALLAGLFSSPMSGVFFSAAAAWYRRFLYLASPARHAPRQAPRGGRQPAGRR